MLPEQDGASPGTSRILDTDHACDMISASSQLWQSESDHLPRGTTHRALAQVLSPSLILALWRVGPICPASAWDVMACMISHKPVSQSNIMVSHKASYSYSTYTSNGPLSCSGGRWGSPASAVCDRGVSLSALHNSAHPVPICSRPMFAHGRSKPLGLCQNYVIGLHHKIKARKVWKWVFWRYSGAGLGKRNWAD